MASSHAGGLLRFMRSLATPAWATATPDAQLLRHFATERDEGAFAALVRRHGPMVLGVCRRVLDSPQDAEATFLARRQHLCRYQMATNMPVPFLPPKVLRGGPLSRHAEA